MADGHDVTLDYTLTDHPLLAPFTVAETPDGRRFTVDGKCPQCRGATSFTVTAGVAESSKGWFRRGPSTDEPVVVTIHCCCGYPHTHRPDSAYFPGCGARWQVRLR